MSQRRIARRQVGVRLRAVAAILLALGWGAAGDFSGAALAQNQGQPAQQQQMQVPGPVRGQPVPSDAYFFIFREFFDGEYDRAVRDFIGQGRGAIKTVESNWIDSICYHAMSGECFYQMGQLARAKGHYDSALQLYVAFADWMIRVQWPSPVLRPANPGGVRPCPWGQSQRPARWAQLEYSDTASIAQGQINNTNVVQRGGVVRMAQTYPIRPGEIVRATTLAIRRRAELLGPLGEADILTKDVLAALTRRPTQPNHWSEAWIDVQLGLAFAAAGKPDQAKPVLERAIVAAGEYNHPLTSVALLELGKIALLEGDLPGAGKWFAEATFAAFQYEDAAILEEAFRYGALVHIVSNQPGVYPPLEIAANWARAQSYRQLQASLSLLLAENLAITGDNRQASAALSTARGLMGSRAMARGKLGARMNFLNATLMYEQGDVEAGETLINNVLSFQRTGSPWMYQIELADTQLGQGTLAPRVAMAVYPTLLREPTASDWLRDPMEALSAIAIPHPQSFDKWFEVALERRELTAALDIAEQGRRHRFLSSLPLGGRPLGLRWILEAPDSALDAAAKLERQDLAVRFPQYEQLSRQARQIHTELSALPLAGADADAERAQTAALKRLTEISAAQEELLRVMSVRRNPGSLYFPPRRTSKEVQDQLAPGQAVLALVATRRHYYGFLLTHDAFNSWEINAPAAIHRKVGLLLKELGMFDANREMQLDQLNGQQWKKPARELWDALTANSKTDLFAGLEELIIVPDGSLWYVPFAALQAGDEAHSEPLIAKVRLRMAPLVSMAVPGGRGRSTTATTAVVLGKLVARDDPETAQAAFDVFSQAVPGSVALSGVLPVSSAVYGSLVRRLVVLDDLRGTEDGALGWSPLPLDPGNVGGTLAEWMLLPYPAPDEVLLPGFHTAAENGLKKRTVENAGSEVFNSVCALMACGTQTVLLSQWRTGGQTSVDLVREFVQELTRGTASESWQRSVELVMAGRVDPQREPRVKLASKEEPPNAAHPFFWAGYLLVDTGATTEADQPAAGDKAVDVAPPGANKGAALAPAADGGAAKLPLEAAPAGPREAGFASPDAGDPLIAPDEPGATTPNDKPAAPKSPKKAKSRAARKPPKPKPLSAAQQPGEN